MQDLKKTIESKFTNKISDFTFEYCGLLEYEQAFKKQTELHEAIFAQKINSCVLGLEHPDVITLGYRANESEIIVQNTQLPIIKVTRGGLATIHSRGQLVIYPIVDIKKLGCGVRDFVHYLLLVTQETLSFFQVDSELENGEVGLYTPKGKIAFCGLQVKNGISLHGLSVNIKNDLELFKNISACGVQNQSLDKLENYNNKITLDAFFNQWENNFKSLR